MGVNIVHVFLLECCFLMDFKFIVMYYEGLLVVRLMLLTEGLEGNCRKNSIKE